MLESTRYYWKKRINFQLFVLDTQLRRGLDEQLEDDGVVVREAPPEFGLPFRFHRRPIELAVDPLPAPARAEENPNDYLFDKLHGREDLLLKMETVRKGQIVILWMDYENPELIKLIARRGFVSSNKMYIGCGRLELDDGRFYLHSNPDDLDTYTSCMCATKEDADSLIESVVDALTELCNWARGKKETAEASTNTELKTSFVSKTSYTYNF